MKLLAITLIMLLMGIGLAQEKTYNESEVITMIEISKIAGGQSAFAGVQKILRDFGASDFNAYYTSITDANKHIRLYNLMLEEHFNGSMVAQMKLEEYSL